MITSSPWRKPRNAPPGIGLRGVREPWRSDPDGMPCNGRRVGLQDAQARCRIVSKATRLPSRRGRGLWRPGGRKEIYGQHRTHHGTLLTVTARIPEEDYWTLKRVLIEGRTTLQDWIRVRMQSAGTPGASERMC